MPPRTHAQNVETGRESQRAGKAFEVWIEGQLQKAEWLGILAHHHHNEPRTQYITRNGQKVLEYVEPSVSDFQGVLEMMVTETHSRSLALEAKSTSKDRLLASAISADQRRHLDATARTRNLALLLVEFTKPLSLPERFCIPWLAVPWKVLRTAQSIALEDLTPWTIPRDPTGCFMKQFHPGGPSSIKPTRVFPRE